VAVEWHNGSCCVAFKTKRISKVMFPAPWQRQEQHRREISSATSTEQLERSLQQENDNEDSLSLRRSQSAATGLQDGVHVRLKLNKVSRIWGHAGGTVASFTTEPDSVEKPKRKHRFDDESVSNISHSLYSSSHVSIDSSVPNWTRHALSSALQQTQTDLQLHYRRKHPSSKTKARRRSADDGSSGKAAHLRQLAAIHEQSRLKAGIRATVSTASTAAALTRRSSSSTSKHYTEVSGTVLLL
jgi:hypothetical protein